MAKLTFFQTWSVGFFTTRLGSNRDCDPSLACQCLAPIETSTCSSGSGVVGRLTYKATTNRNGIKVKAIRLTVRLLELSVLESADVVWGSAVVSVCDMEFERGMIAIANFPWVQLP